MEQCSLFIRTLESSIFRPKSPGIGTYADVRTASVEVEAFITVSVRFICAP